MKKLNNLLVAIVALLAFATADANRGCRRRSCEKKCENPVKPASCKTKVQCRTVYEPCTKWVQVKGVCPHEIKCVTTTCCKESKRCTGPCAATCENAANPSDTSAGQPEAFDQDQAMSDE